MSRYSISKKLERGFERTLEETRTVLERDDFRITCELDMTEALREGLEKEFRNYRVLSVMNAPLVHKALMVETEAGLILPSQIVIYENDEGGSTVAAIDPVLATSVIENPALAIIAKELRDKLERTIASLN